MINYFRRIRKQFSEENKPLKYVRYAIGEIVLVVIGILIALSLNNWNQNRQLKKDELNILKSLHNEMVENFEQFDYNFSLHIQKKDAIETILFSNLKEFGLNQFDSIGKLYVISYTYNPSFSVYNTLVNSGKIELISNGPLKYRISKYKDFVIDYIENEVLTRKNTEDFIWKYVVKESSISAKKRFGLESRSAQEQVEDRNFYLNEFQSIQFQNTMTMLKFNMDNIILEGGLVKQETLDLIEFLDKEVKEKEDQL